MAIARLGIICLHKGEEGLLFYMGNISQRPLRTTLTSIFYWPEQQIFVFVTACPNLAAREAGIVNSGKGKWDYVTSLD